MAGRQKLSTGRKWGEELLKTYDLQPYETTPSNSVLPVLNPNFIQADAQPRQVTVSGILQGAIDEQIISPVAGSNTEIQYNASGVLGASADLTWDDTGKELGVGGDINLDDGGTYSTTLQVVTATADRTISFPDATGTVALVAGSTGQLTYNSAGAQAGLTSASIGSTGEINISLAGAASTPPVSFTGTWFTGGTATTTKPQVLIEPTGTTSTAWSTDGTGLGVNAASGFSGRLLDLQTNGTSRMVVQGDGKLGLGTSSPAEVLHLGGSAAQTIRINGNTNAMYLGTVGDITQVAVNRRPTDGTIPNSARGTAFINVNGLSTGGSIELATSASANTGATTAMTIDSSQRVGIGTTSPSSVLHLKTASSPTLILDNSDSATAAIIDTWWAGTPLAFNIGSAEKARIDGSGRLLVGTSTGSAPLTVAGTNIEVRNTNGAYVNNSQTTSVSTSATTIVADAGFQGRLWVINGAESNDRFCDLVMASTAAAPVVVQSYTAIGSPAARTYTRSGSALQLAMASGTYVVRCIGMGA